MTVLQMLLMIGAGLGINVVLNRVLAPREIARWRKQALDGDKLLMEQRALLDQLTARIRHLDASSRRWRKIARVHAPLSVFQAAALEDLRELEDVAEGADEPEFLN